MTSTSPASSGSPIPLPPGVTLAPDGDGDALVVDTPAARASLRLDGAHLTSWIPAGEEEVLWMSPLSASGPGQATRGGIPIVGPWFGPGRDGGQDVKHGWLRTLRWDLTAVSADPTGVELVLTSPADAGEVRAALTVRIGEELSVDLTLTAQGGPLALEAALHTYVAVGDVREVRIHGLEGSPYLDNTRELAADTLPAEPLRLTAATDRIVTSSAPVTIEDRAGGRRILSTPRGTTRTVVWNPWDTLSAPIADLPDDAWPRFLCLEPAVAKDGFVALEDGQSHTLGVTCTVLR